MRHHEHDPDGSGDGDGHGPEEDRPRRPEGSSAAGPGREPDREPRDDAGGTGHDGSAGEGGPTGEDGPSSRRARRAWGDAFSEVQDLVGGVVGDVLENVRDAAGGRFPRMDLVRVEGEGYRLLVDLPGLSREDIEVVTLGNELTLKGERPRPDLPEGSEILRTERAHGRFERTIRMPPEVREEGVSASFRDGVLTVRLPRSEATDARRVDIG